MKRFVSLLRYRLGIRAMLTTNSVHRSPFTQNPLSRPPRILFTKRLQHRLIQHRETQRRGAEDVHFPQSYQTCPRRLMQSQVVRQREVEIPNEAGIRRLYRQRSR